MKETKSSVDTQENNGWKQQPFGIRLPHSGGWQGNSTAQWNWNEWNHVRRQRRWASIVSHIVEWVGRITEAGGGVPTCQIKTRMITLWNNGDIGGGWRCIRDVIQRGTAKKSYMLEWRRYSGNRRAQWEDGQQGGGVHAIFFYKEISGNRSLTIMGTGDVSIKWQRRIILEADRRRKWVEILIW